MQTLVQMLYVISTAVQPVVVAVLLALLAWALLGVGGLGREAWERRRLAPHEDRLRRWREQIVAASFPDLLARFEAQGPYPGLLALVAARLPMKTGAPEGLRFILEEVELHTSHRLARLALAARVAPMIGMIGTLTPLGPALIGLSKGQLDVLASNLVVAFGTTVVGLVASCLFQLMVHTRRSWYSSDLSFVERFCDLPPDAGHGT